MTTKPNNSIPNEFYTTSTFFTLGGTAGAVWLFCLVLANLDPEGDFLTPKYFRFIALGLSLIIAGIMLGRQKMAKKFEHWLLAFFNGLLIFINASGLNAISSKLSFENVDSVQERSIDQPGVQESSTFSLLNIPFFKNEVSWWADDSPNEENKKLSTENKNLKQQMKGLDKRLNKSLDDLRDQNIKMEENLDLVRRCEEKLQKLKDQLENESRVRLKRQVDSLKRRLRRCQQQRPRIQ